MGIAGMSMKRVVMAALESISLKDMMTPLSEQRMTLQGIPVTVVKNDVSRT